jgi:hypothetical protein
MTLRLCGRKHIVFISGAPVVIGNVIHMLGLINDALAGLARRQGDTIGALRAREHEY